MQAKAKNLALRQMTGPLGSRAPDIPQTIIRACEPKAKGDVQAKAENLALRQMTGPQGAAWDASVGDREKELLLAAALEEEQGRRGRLQEDNARLRAALVPPAFMITC